MSKQPTAVEFLVDELGLVEYEGLPQPEWIKHLISEAKKMEKQQIIEAWIDGNDSEPKETTGHYAEQYYTETFNK